MRLLDLPLVDASVSEQATLLAAAQTLVDAKVAAIAVLRSDRTVAGLFTEDDVLRGIFPSYVAELRHTAFVEDLGKAVRGRLQATAADPVTRYMRTPLVVGLETSAFHAAERFLHCPWGAVAVVDHDRFVGMLRQGDFVAALLRSV
jgi:CBS-domain-containing membrane protein